MTSTDLRDAFLAYRAKLGPTLLVDSDKKPLHRLNPLPPESDLLALIGRAHGLALRLWPESPVLVLDFDGAHAEAAWATTRIELPETARTRTRSGGRHLYFQIPPGTPAPGTDGNGHEVRRKVRIVKAACNCAKPCGVDLLLNGYAVCPPTPGYTEDPDHPLELAHMAALPQAVIDLARSNGNGGNGHRAAGPIGERILEGQREAVLVSLAGSMRRRGASEAAILAALKEENGRCDPPLAEADLTRIARSVGRYTPAPTEQTRTAAPCVEAPPLHVPDAGMIGVARDFAMLHAAYLEAPASFFYFSFLTYFGINIAAQVTLDSSLCPEPRLYTVLLGESADTRKSTALRMTDQFFRSLGGEWETGRLLGVGSAEGLAAALKEQTDHTLLLHFDELKSFVDKARAESSVLLPMVASLFERSEYDNRTKENAISVRGARLALLAACTADTYATMFDQRFFAIGLLNRLWLVADRATLSIAIPQPIPAAELEAIRARTIGLLQEIRGAWRRNAYQPVALEITPPAMTMFKAWYAAREGSLFERRLDTYGHRLMVLLAASSGKMVVDEEIMAAVLALLRYQLDTRRECDPVNAENALAILEERIRRALARGAVTGRDLKRKLHPERVGIWQWNTAVENLRMKSREIQWDRKRDLYWLTGAVTTTVTTSKEGLNAHE